MKNKAFRFLRNNWIAIWLFIVAYSVVSVFSYAAYTGTTTAKRVISLSSRDSLLFSSRYLSKAGTDIQTILINYEEVPTTAPVVVIDVCNYDANGNVYGANFGFKLKARLVKTDGSEISSAEWSTISPKPLTYKIAYKSVSSSMLTNEYKASLSGSALALTNAFQYLADGQVYSFLGSDQTRYFFDTTFDLNDIIQDGPAYGIEIIAELDGTYSDLESLSGKLKVVKGGTTTKKTWEGKYLDNTSAGRKPENYDAINYQISGNAIGIVHLTYRNDLVEIDKDCYAELNIQDSDGSGNNKTLNILVNPDENSMYEIRFYWINGTNGAVSFDEDFIKVTFDSN